MESSLRMRSSQNGVTFTTKRSQDLKKVKYFCCNLQNAINISHSENYEKRFGQRKKDRKTEKQKDREKDAKYPNNFDCFSALNTNYIL